MKPCRICAAQIPGAAIKCTACDSYQDWRGGFGINATTMSLIVALVALLPAAIRGVSDLLTPKDSHIIVGKPELQLDYFIQFVSNTGVRPGAITGGALVRASKTARFETEIFTLDLVGATNGHKILNPGESALLEFSIGPIKSAIRISVIADPDVRCTFGTDVHRHFEALATGSNLEVDCDGYGAVHRGGEPAGGATPDVRGRCRRGATTRRQRRAATSRSLSNGQMRTNAPSPAPRSKPPSTP